MTVRILSIENENANIDNEKGCDIVFEKKKDGKLVRIVEAHCDTVEEARRKCRWDEGQYLVYWKVNENCA